jgi:hypothetical protein
MRSNFSGTNFCIILLFFLDLWTGAFRRFLDWNSVLFLFATDTYVWPTESFLIELRQSYWENATYHEFSLRILDNIPNLPSRNDDRISQVPHEWTDDSFTDCRLNEYYCLFLWSPLQRSKISSWPSWDSPVCKVTAHCWTTGFRFPKGAGVFTSLPISIWSAPFLLSKAFWWLFQNKCGRIVKFTTNLHPA